MRRGRKKTKSLKETAARFDIPWVTGQKAEELVPHDLGKKPYMERPGTKRLHIPAAKKHVEQPSEWDLYRLTNIRPVPESTNQPPPPITVSTKRSKRENKVIAEIEEMMEGE